MCNVKSEDYQGFTRNKKILNWGRLLQGKAVGSGAWPEIKDP